MTYCVALRLDRGIVFAADTRTNAGVDDISQVRKMRSWHVPGERVITLMSAGNLATTQGVVSLLDERLKAPGDRHPPILTAASMFEVATIIGETLRGIVMRYGAEGQNAESIFRASLIVGGQIRGGEPRLFLIYPEGNFIESGEDNPFFQIGETKYGKPILVRAYEPGMTFSETAKLLMVSFDSTIRSNLSVGLPLDMLFYERDTFRVGYRTRITQDDPYYREVSEGWSDALKSAFKRLPDFQQ